MISTQLQDGLQKATEATQGNADATVANADAEIARMRCILADIDTLKSEFDKVRLIRDVVRRLRCRVDEAENRLSQTMSGPECQPSRGLGVGNFTASLLPHCPLLRRSLPQNGEEGHAVCSQGASPGLSETGSISSYCATQYTEGPLHNNGHDIAQHGFGSPSESRQPDSSSLPLAMVQASDIHTDTSPQACDSNREEDSASAINPLEAGVLRSLRRVLACSFRQRAQESSRNHVILGRPEQIDIEFRIEFLPTKNLALSWWADHDCELGEQSAAVVQQQRPWETLLAHGRIAGSIQDEPALKLILIFWETEFRRVLQESGRLQTEDWRLNLEVDEPDATPEGFLSRVLKHISYRLCTSGGFTGPRQVANGQGSSPSSSDNPPDSQSWKALGNGGSGTTKRSRSTFGPCDDGGGDGDDQGDQQGGRGNSPKRAKPTAEVYAQYLVCTEHAAGQEAENPSCVFSAWPTVDRLKQVSAFECLGHRSSIIS
jgi:hypothetical protein